MKKMGKAHKMLSLLMIIMIVLSFSIPVAARTHTITATLGTSRPVTASSQTSAQSGISSTGSAYSDVTCTVSATYIYVNAVTLATGSQLKTANSSYAAGVSFSAPTNCYTIALSGSHKAVWSGQTWTGSTSVNGY